jgi:hypothetical protein
VPWPVVAASNAVRFRARGLRPGRYRLPIAPAGGRPRSAGFRIAR